MYKMKTTYTISEYGSLVCDKEISGYTSLPEHTFTQLENFILNTQNGDTDALEIMGLSARKGIGKIITAKNYVGIITMKDGTSVEILPKVYSKTDTEVSEVRARKVLIEMLKTLRNTPFKSLQTSNVNVEKMSIFEIFIRMFIDEMFSLVKRGLKCNYETVEENANFFKGKMKFSQQIKYNLAHRERNYIEYDSFTANRPENRLLKSTLQYLYKQSTSSKNRTDIQTLLNSFADVAPSQNYKSDFKKYIPDRNMKDYTTALTWSQVFLTGKSFTAFAGSEVAVALLFPMEKLFESYVAAKVKKELIPRGYSVSTQDSTKHLFDSPKQFPIRPDIVAKSSDGTVFIMDTKWKILSSNYGQNYGISQGDMYQMYAYQKKYPNCKNVTLIYPQPEEKIEPPIAFSDKDGVNIRVKFIDLLNTGDLYTLLDLDTDTVSQ